MNSPMRLGGGGKTKNKAYIAYVDYGYGNSTVK